MPDLWALKALKGSPLALEVSSRLTYRLRTSESRFQPAGALQKQLGADHGRLEMRLLSYPAQVSNVDLGRHIIRPA